MASPPIQGGAASGAVVVEPPIPGQRWPVDTRWRGVLEVKGEWRAPEWVVARVRAVPLSSRAERSLLQAVAEDDGRAVLEQASNPGEHNVAAAVIAALRIADAYPDRAVRLLEWIRTSPTDPSNLRFLRRYLPGLNVLVELAPGVPAAVPLSMSALALLQSELVRAGGDLAGALAAISAIPASLAKCVAQVDLLRATGDGDSALALCENQTIQDSLSAALAAQHASILVERGEARPALAITNKALAIRGLAGPVDHVLLEARLAAQEALELSTEAELTRSELSGHRTRSYEAPGESSIEAPGAPPPGPAPRAAASPGAGAASTAPSGPLFGRDLADALDDAWARVRRQPVTGPDSAAPGPDDAERITEEALALVGTNQFEAVETLLLGYMDRIDDAADRGEDFDDTCFVLLAGIFDRQNLPPEEVATLERLRATYVRAGKELPEKIANRLVERRALLDRLAQGTG